MNRPIAYSGKRKSFARKREEEKIGERKKEELFMQFFGKKTQV
jgi:hypothetical protein